MTTSDSFRLHPSGKLPGPGARIAIRVAYDGTRYRGWQVQPGGPSIQGELECALHRLTGVTTRIFGSGRTDSGVHAREQVAHFDLPFRPGPGKLLIGFNALLDPDIRVLSVKRVRPDFHARFSATGKEYRYLIWNGEVLPPFLRLFRYQVRKPLDLEAMRDAAARLVGHHDFAAFTANPNREVEGTDRTLYAFRISRKGSDFTLAVQGDGFLYRMVRSLAGHVIRVGLGELKAAQTEEILRSKIRTARVPTAPPQGLFLWRVMYGTGGG